MPLIFRHGAADQFQARGPEEADIQTKNAESFKVAIW